MEDKQSAEDQYRKSTLEAEHLRLENASLRQQLIEAHKLLKSAGIAVSAAASDFVSSALNGALTVFSCIEARVHQIMGSARLGPWALLSSFMRS